MGVKEVQLILAKAQGVDMGGMGSGNRSRREGRKSTVEESLTLPMKELRRTLYRGAAGAFT
jgi:hypothetical protein